MKQVNFFNILMRSFVAFALVATPLSPAMAASSNLAETEPSAATARSSQMVQFDSEMAPALVVQNKIALAAVDGVGTDTYNSETIVVRTETPEQYDATVRWLNRQMDVAQAKKLNYQLFDIVPTSNEGPQLTKFFKQDVAPQHLANTVSLPMQPDTKLPSWSSRMFDRLGQLAFNATKDSKSFVRDQSARIKNALSERKRRATITLAKNEKWYVATFVLGRFFINGGYATYSFYHATGNLGASLLAGGLLMGGVSAILQWKVKAMSRYLSKRDRLSVKFENKLLGFAEHRKGEPLSDAEAEAIVEKVKKVSEVKQWLTLEVPFLVAPNLALLTFGYNLMGTTVSAAAVHLFWVLVGSMAAQSSWDAANSARKELDVRQSGQDPDQLLIADYRESLRSLLISTSCVAGVCMAMGSTEPLIAGAGFAALAGLTVGGWFYRQAVSKDTALYSCEEKLRARLAFDKAG